MLASQRGQAIVIIALMLTAIIGMAALAIDGSRAYALRRDLQAAVDAAALAAGDRLQQSGSYTAAETAATNIFGTNLRLYTAPSCSPGYGSPGVGSYTVTCTFSNGTALTQVVSSLGPQGSRFDLTATSALQLQFGRLLANTGSVTLGTTASSAVGNLVYTPAIAALDQAGCGGTSGSAVSINGGGTLNVIGDVASAGAVTITAAAMNVAGDLYARCQSGVAGATMACYPSGAVAPCTFPDTLGVTRTGFRLVDPGYPTPSVTGGSQGLPASDVVLSPGIYAADPNFSAARCYFLSAGVYEWQGGFTNAGGFVSNELKSPDEPQVGNNTLLGHQMWNTGGANCAGSFQLNGQSGIFDIRQGTWSVVLTATRTEIRSGINYKRESAPSACRQVSVGNGQVIKVQVSNVPGATGYNAYFAPPGNGCSGPFGFGGSIIVTTAVHNDSTAGCPAFSGTSCSLGNEGAIFDGTVLGNLFGPNPLAAPGVIGAYPPSSETPPLRVNLPNQNPDRAAPPGGDRANENQCSSVVGAAVTCPGPITPGAVQFYIPATGCLNATTSGDNFLFSGYQYNWIMLFEPGYGNPPANTCSNMLGAAADSAWVGLMYTPAAAMNVSKAATFRTEATGGLMADTITFSGQLPTIIYNAAYAPTPPATRITY